VSQKRHCFGFLVSTYNFHVHQPILIIFGRNVAKKASSQTVLCFPTSPNYCFCTTWGNIKPKIASFHLNAKSCFASRHRKHIHTITCLQLNRPSFSQESAVCTKQDLESEYSMLPVCNHTFIVYQVCYGVDRCVKSGSCSLSSLEWKVNRHYWWDILLSQQMLAVIKRFVDNNITCLSGTQLNTVQQLLQSAQLYFSWAMAPTGRSWTQLITRFKESISS